MSSLETPIIIGAEGSAKTSLPKADPIDLKKEDKKTYSFARKFFEGAALILMNLTIIGLLVNLEMLRGDKSWLKREYQRVFLDKEITTIKTGKRKPFLIPKNKGKSHKSSKKTASTTGDTRARRTFTEHSDRSLTLVEGDRDVVEREEDLVIQADRAMEGLIGKTFTVELPEGLEGELSFLDHTTTLFHAPETGTDGQLPMLEQQQPSGTLTRLYYGATNALSTLFGTNAPTVSMREEKVHLRLVVEGIESIFRVTITAPNRRFTEGFIRSVSSEMVGRLPPPPSAGHLMLEAPPQQLMIQAPREVKAEPVMVSLQYDPIPRPFPLYGQDTDIDTRHAQPLQLGGVDQVVQEREEPRTHQPRRNFGLVNFLFYMLAARARNGGFTPNRTATPQQPADNPGLFSRIYAQFARVVSYMTQTAQDYTFGWWQNAAPVNTVEGEHRGAHVRVDLLHVNPLDDKVQVVETVN